MSDHLLSTSLTSLLNSDDCDESESYYDDPELSIHYICKSIQKGLNFACPFDASMKKVLNIGYGAGHWMMEMATDFPKSQFYGIDIDPNSPDLVYPDNCFFQETLQNSYSILPYENEEFDLIYIRMTLYTLPKDQIPLLFKEISRVIKKGGYLEFLEPVSENNQLLIGNNEEYYNSILEDLGFSGIKNDRISMDGEFYLQALQIFIDSTEDEERKDLIKSLDRLGQFISVLSGFAQKS